MGFGWLGAWARGEQARDGGKERDRDRGRVPLCCCLAQLGPLGCCPVTEAALGGLGTKVAMTLLVYPIGSQDLPSNPASSHAHLCP